MENKLSKKLVPLGLIATILIVAFFAAQFLLRNISEKIGQTKPADKDSMEINTKSFEKIQSPENAAVNISLDQSGFGRANPFAPYK